jgi:hypothetical protein
MAGFATALTIPFHYIHLSRATSRNWSGLTFRFAAFLSPPIPATAQAQTLAASAGQDQTRIGTFACRTFPRDTKASK